jgi:DedD protein
MASGGKRGGGDRILESRHLVGLFLGVVLLCGVFFTLGYVMGRTQYGGPVHADVPARPAPREPAPAAKPADTSGTASSTPTEWDFYAKKDNDHLEPAAKDPSPGVAVPDPQPAPDPAPPPAAQPAPKPSLTPVKAGGHSQPKPAKPSFLLQVAAMTLQSDALAMADLLQRKRFPSFVAAPSAADKLYRVQVGPYADEHAADNAKSALDRAGFKAIIKR